MWRNLAPKGFYLMQHWDKGLVLSPVDMDLLVHLGGNKNAHDFDS